MTLAVGGLGLFFSGSAAAHDFFLIPEEFVGTSGRPLIVHATSSSDFPALLLGSPRTRIAEVRAVVGDHPAAVEVQEQTVKSLRLALSSDTSGMGSVTLQTIWGESSWRPDMVDTYLDEHPFKADEVATVRRLLPKGSTLQIRSRRLAKTLVCVRICTPPTRAAAGLEVELVPEFDAEGTSPARVQLLRNGRPLTAHPVTLRGEHVERQNLLTDNEGWVRLPAAMSGPVMLLAATLDPPTEPGGRFTTNNASLTFQAGHGRTEH
ncbi:DUF4198 domain-containing protein [Sphingomonas koreensis]|uniref:DUF4198 domain-containing protein n=1 Tax=Sphingomonas koreensis TaxID=93064 RepID=UPI0019D3177E|nr:DUF4198 domain-containing protein [Sphingomonas koreensis]